jgi:two-component system chemotaxis response regulator CheY
MKKMIVIDDSLIRAQLRKKFESKGYEVIEAEDGFKGGEIIKDNPNASVIIIDLHMPGMDGLTMLEIAKKENLSPHVPKIVLTTESSFEMLAKGKAVGVTSWFVKPLTEGRLEVLNDTIHLLVDKK